MNEPLALLNECAEYIEHIPSCAMMREQPPLLMHRRKCTCGLDELQARVRGLLRNQEECTCWSEEEAVARMGRGLASPERCAYHQRLAREEAERLWCDDCKGYHAGECPKSR